MADPGPSNKGTCRESELTTETLHWSMLEFGEIEEQEPNGESSEIDLISILALAQELDFPFLPITWQPGLGLLGRGNTADVSHSVINPSTKFAFKRIRPRFNDSNGLQMSLKAVIDELRVLGTRGIKGHPGIIRCEGICFEQKAGSADLLPVLVFLKASHGTLRKFMYSSEGASLPMKSRIQMCITMVAAVKQLHESGCFHGDLKPENILVFEENGRFMARIADFGHSRSGENHETVTLAKSRPWFPNSQAPEMNILQAQRVDSYALGLLCFWLLCLVPLKEDIEHENVDTIDYPPYDLVLQNIEQWQSSGSLLENVRQLVQAHKHISNQDKVELRCIFDLSLDLDAATIDLSSSKIFHMWQNIGSYEDPGAVPRQEYKSNVTRCHEIPQVLSMTYELAVGSYCVRTALFKTLEKRAQTENEFPNCEQCCHEIEYQIACCYFVGLGTRRDLEKSESWLKKAGRSQSDMTSELHSILQQNMTHIFHNSLMLHLLENGQVFLADLVDYDDENEDLENILQQEAHDFEQVFGSTHDITILSKLGLAARACRRLNSGAMMEAVGVLSSMVDQFSWKFALMTLRCLSYLGVLYRELGKLNSAESLFIIVSKTLSGGSFPTDHPFNISVTADLASCHFVQGKLDEAELEFTQALGLSEKTLSLQHPETLSNMANLGAVMRSKGRLAEAEELGRKAMAGAEKLLGHSHPTKLAIMSSLASTLHVRGKIAETDKLLNQLKDLSMSDTSIWDPQSILTLSRLANLLSETGNFKKAESLAQQILDRQLQVLDFSEAMATQILLNITTVLAACGGHSESEHLLATLSEKIGSIKNPDHLYHLPFLENQASFLRRKGQKKEAERLQTKIAQIRTERFGEDHPETIKARFDLALILHEQDDFDKAWIICDDAVHRSYEILGTLHPDTLRRRLDQISMIRDRGDAAKSSRFEMEVLQICIRTLGNQHPVTIHAEKNLAMSFWKLGEVHKAVEMETKILSTYQSSLGEAHPNTVHAKASLGSSLVQIENRVEEAKHLFIEVLAIYTADWGLRDPRTLTILSELALANARLSHLEEADKMLKQVVEIRIQVLGVEHPATIRAAQNMIHVEELLRESREAGGVTNVPALGSS